MTCHRQARRAKFPAYISIAAAAQRGLAPARAALTAPNCTREKAIARNKKVQARPIAIWKRRRFMPASRKLNFTTALGVSRQVNALAMANSPLPPSRGTGARHLTPFSLQIRTYWPAFNGREKWSVPDREIFSSD